MKQAGPPPGKNRTVLIVDDEPHIVNAIKRLLRRDDYEILTAMSGEQAYEMLQDQEAAVVISDQRMPGMSGAELLTKAYELQPDGYRITLTGYTDLDAAQQSINQGHIQRFLVKPWDDQSLRKIVAEGMRSYNLVALNQQLQDLTRKQNNQLKSWNQSLEDEVAKRTQALEARNEELTKLRQQAEHSLADFVIVFSSLLELSSPALGIHSRRVAETAKLLGELLDCEEQTVQEMVYAAHLHDIGKLIELIPNDQRAPRGKEKPQDYTGIGASLLARVHGFERVVDGIRHQRERYDGTGTPKALKQSQIPLISRVLYIANLYDEAVFRHDDPTHPRYADGIKALNAQKGIAIDPLLAETLINHLTERTEAVETEVELSNRQLKPGMRLSKDLCNIDDVLMLKAGTVLNDEIIDRIQYLCRREMMLNSICVITSAPPSDQALRKQREAQGQTDSEVTGEDSEQTSDPTKGSKRSEA